MTLKQKTILVTGGAGFIGSTIVEKVCKNNKVIILDNLSTGDLKNLEGLQVDFRQGDCREIFEKVSEKIDIILHLGIASSTTLYLTDKNLVASQIASSIRVFEKAIKDKAKVIIASSSSLYNQGPLPSQEEQEIKITDFYTECRLCIERLAELYCNLYEMKAVCLRMFSVYGGKKELAKKNYANMLTKFVLKIRQSGNPVSFGDGTQQRDFIYIDDMVNAWLLAIKYDKANFNIFNVGTGQCYNFNQVLAIVNKVMGTNAEMEYERNPLPNFVFKTWANTKKAENILGFKAKYSLEKGIKKMLDELR